MSGELNGWKEIAGYIGKSVRTAQRWEQELALPVRRMRTAGGETVYAVRKELDLWKQEVEASAAGREALDSGESGANAEGQAPELPGAVLIPTPEPTDTPPRRRTTPVARRWLAAALAVAVAAAAGLLWLARRPQAAPDRAAASVPSALARVSDGGPWPTRAHDMKRTNQSPLAGPVEPSEAALVYASGSPDDGIVDLVSTLDGKLVFGGCGRLLAIERRSRRLLWERELVAGGHRVLPVGITVDLVGDLLVSGAECPDVPGGFRTGLLVLSPNGALGKVVPQGSTYSGPAIGPDRTVYTLDEITLLRAYQHWFEQKWATSLAGFSNRGIAIDSRGNLYAGTDGGRVHQSSLWSVRPEDGEVRWRALREDLGLPAIDASDNVYVAGRPGAVHAFTADGQERWSAQVGTVSSLWPLAVGRSGTVYVHASTEIVALRSDGTRRWTFSPGTGGNLDAAPVLDRDENLYTALGDTIYCVTPNGKERWRLPLKQPGAVIVGDEGVLYAVSEQRNVYAITPLRPPRVPGM